MKIALAVLFVLTAACAFAAEENPPTLAIGAEAPDFALPAVDGKTYHLRDFASSKVLVIVFTCDHCPTAQLYEGRIKQLAADYRGRGVVLVAIQPNDPMSVELNEMGYTDVGDSFAEMKVRAEYRHFNFPYLYDGKTQATARKYGPAATPHVFIFDRDRKLRYQGRVDDNSREELAKQHDARDAIEALLADRPVAVPVTPTFGCSTKWAFKEAGRAAEMAAIEKEPVKIESVDAEGLKALRKNSEGKVLLVDFWATNCSRCVQELPEFETTYRMYRNRAFEFVTVSTDHPDEQKGVVAVLQRLHASSENLLFGTTDQRGLMAAFDPQWNSGAPYTVLIGTDGTIVYQHQGPTEAIHIRRLVLATIPDDDYIGIRGHWSTNRQVGRDDFVREVDVGGPLLAGSASYDAAKGQYRIKGGGANMWEHVDAFHILYRPWSGDVTLSAHVAFPAAGGNEHKKAGWMVRQGLGPSAPYADLVVHASGLTSLQYRLKEGGDTQEIQSEISVPDSIRLVRLGNTFSLWASRPGGPMELAGSVEVPLHDPVNVGLVVCSHDAAVLEEAVLSNVDILGGKEDEQPERAVESRLEVISVDGSERRVVYRAEKRFEAPNWSRDGKLLFFNSGGRIYTLPIEGGEPRLLDTGEAIHCNNDHGFSPDGQWLAISNSPGNSSLIYVLPAGGGKPRQVTERGPSYWHGWSPDGKTLAYCADRGGNFDVYTIPVEGGEERRLTDAPGLDDGPDYSPDGQYIYFNSERTGWMQIWRMRPDGSAQEQVTNDDYADWFAHPSPDGKWLVFLSFDKHVKGHPPNKDVMLRLMPTAGGEPHVLVKLFGGQGTNNVPSWSPDSKHLAFVSYRLLK